MAGFDIGKLQSWAKKMKYPDMIDLHRMETSHCEIPVRCTPFLQWLTKLSSKNSIEQFDMTPEEFDCKFKLNSSSRRNAGIMSPGTQIEYDSDDEFSSIDELNQELLSIENSNEKMKRKIACITRKIKETESTVAQHNNRQKKESHPADCLKLAREQDLTVSRISNELHSLPLKTRDKFDRLRSAIDDIVKIEMTLLRNMAATSASKQNEPASSSQIDSSRILPTQGKGQSLNTSLKCETKSFLAVEAGDSPEKEAESKRLYMNQLHETRLKLLEVFYLAKIRSVRYADIIEELHFSDVLYGFMSDVICFMFYVLA